MSTLGLALITNSYDETNAIVNKYMLDDGYCFDKLYITVADKNKQLYYRLKKELADYKFAELSYFKWVDSFGKARLFNQEQITTDYWFWCDSDDQIEHPEELRNIVDLMERDDLDCVYLKYNYFQNEHGEGVNDHWRERVIRTKSALKWADVPVHETLLAPGAASVKLDWVSVKHHKTYDDILKSQERNHKLLRKHWNETKDPRTAFYLGETALAQKSYAEARDFYHFLIEEGGWDEQKYVAWCRIADSYYNEHRYGEALVATNMAINLHPELPDAYYQKVLIYAGTDELNKAIEWVNVAVSKKPNEDSLQMTDPTLYSHRGLFMAAQAYLFSGKPKEAFRFYQRVKSIAPHYIKEYERETETEWSKLFEESFYDQKAIDYARYLTHYLRDNGGTPAKLFEALPGRLSSDIRLNAERVLVYPPKRWPNRSIAYYCGPSTETWGPDTLEKGMGGSEEAVVYLSRELQLNDWSVTVFNDRDEPHYDSVKQTKTKQGIWDSGVTYKPWTELNPYDTYDVFIAWRAPENARGVKARKVICDLHDCIEPERVYAGAEYVDLYFVKSQYHRSLYPDLPDEKFCIIGNGILESHFK